MFFTVNQEQKDEVAKIVETLNSGWVVLYPSWKPWHWALAADATNPGALEKILAMKKEIRPDHGIVFVQDEMMVEKYISPIPDFVRHFLHHQEKPVTVIFHETWQIGKQVCEPHKSVKVRIISSVDVPSVQMSRHIIRLFGKPIFVTTAVVESPLIILPQTAQDIDAGIISSVNYHSYIECTADETWDFSMIITYDDNWTIQTLRK